VIAVQSLFLEGWIVGPPLVGCIVKSNLALIGADGAPTVGHLEVEPLVGKWLTVDWLGRDQQFPVFPLGVDAGEIAAVGVQKSCANFEGLSGLRFKRSLTTDTVVEFLSGLLCGY